MMLNLNFTRSEQDDGITWLWDLRFYGVAELEEMGMTYKVRK